MWPNFRTMVGLCLLAASTGAAAAPGAPTPPEAGEQTTASEGTQEAPAEAASTSEAPASGAQRVPASEASPVSDAPAAAASEVAEAAVVGPAAAEEAPKKKKKKGPSPFLLELRDGFRTEFRTLLFGQGWFRERNALHNPDNRVANLPDATVGLHFRPDFRLDTTWFSLMLKPRVTVDSAWRYGLEDPEQRVDVEPQIYLQEYRAQLNLASRVFLSFGREVVRWGPSIAMSPSNPYYLDDGRNNPYIEVPGMSFARLVAIPHPMVSISLTSNLLPDRDPRFELPFETFHRMHTLKLDLTGTFYNLSVLGTYRESGVGEWGGFGQFTVGEAWLLYYDFIVRHGTDARYPYRDQQIAGWSVEPYKTEPGRLLPSALAGFSYTLERGPTLSLEYLYNGEGYTADEVADYWTLAEEVTPLYRPNELREIAAGKVLGESIHNRLRFLRRNYVSVQVSQQDIADQLNLIARFTYSIDDNSWVLTPILEWNFSDFANFYVVGVVNGGPPRSDFGRLLRAQVTGGITFFVW